MLSVHGRAFVLSGPILCLLCEVEESLEHALRPWQ